MMTTTGTTTATHVFESVEPPLDVGVGVGPVGVVVVPVDGGDVVGEIEVGSAVGIPTNTVMQHVTVVEAGEPLQNNPTHNTIHT